MYPFLYNDTGTLQMKKVALFSILLVLGLVGSQILPGILGDAYGPVDKIISLLTMMGLSFIMIHVGYEFDIVKSRIRSYGWDYVVAMTAAAFPWIFVSLYFVVVMLPSQTWFSIDAWKESLLAGLFAAPTSAGVLFSMLAAAGLSATWLFKKARVLAIFDDLGTVLLMIPLKIMIVGFAPQLLGIILVMALMLWIGWRYLHAINLSAAWPWVLLYSLLIVLVTELIYAGSLYLDDQVPVHLEVLLPAFVLGMVMKRPEGSDPHVDDQREGHQEGPESTQEQRVSTIISAAFMVLVGLSMPALFASGEGATGQSLTARFTASIPMPDWTTLALHVLALTVLSNIGKMVPSLVYRREAHWRERLAVAIGMWPRGEVGAGVLVVSIGYGIGGPILTVAVLSLALNLLLTGVFILIVKRLLRGVPAIH